MLHSYGDKIQHEAAMLHMYLILLTEGLICQESGFCAEIKFTTGSDFPRDMRLIQNLIWSTLLIQEISFPARCIIELTSPTTAENQH